MNKALDKLSEKIEALIGLVGLIGIIIITANVICRFVLKVSMAWSDELLRTMFIYGYFIGAALMFYAGDLMRLELLDAWLEKKGKKGAFKVLKIVLSIINLVFFGILTYYVFTGIIIPFVQSGTHTSTSNTPAWVLPLGYGIGMLIIALTAVKNLVEALIEKR